MSMLTYIFIFIGVFFALMALMRTEPVKEDPPAAATQPAVSTNRAGPRNYVPTGLYTTDDRTAMRPGALDFKKLPSVYCGVVA